MDHIKPVNKKAKQIEDLRQKERPQATIPPEADVHALQQLPLGCTLIFGPGWETDGKGLVTGLCHPMQSDLFGCYDDCHWPAQVPDQLTNALDWSDQCAAAERDWRKLDLIFPEDKSK